MKQQYVDFAQLIKELRAQKPEISVAITMPTAQMMPNKLQDRLVLKYLVTKALRQAKEQYPGRDVQKLAERIDTLIEQYQFDIESHGLALLANEHYGTIMRLPFKIATGMHVDTTFPISVLLQTFARTQPFWLLAITKNMCRLYEAYDTSLHEVVTPLVDSLGNPVQGFPLDYVEPRDKIETAVGQGDKDARHLDDNRAHYFMMVDAELGKKIHEKRMPVVVCGVEKNIAMFRKITKHAADIVGYQHGDYQNRLELAQAVAPIFAQEREKERDALIKRFVEAEGKLHQAFGMRRVWLMACEGRIDCLLIEEGLVVPGTVDPTNKEHLMLADKLMPEKKIGNVVEALLEQVIATRGRIIFVPQGTLKDFERVGAILRY